MKNKEIAINIMRKLTKNGKFTTKEEKLLNFFILNYKNKKGQVTEPFKNTFEQYQRVDTIKKDSEKMKKVYDYILNFIQKEHGGKREGAGRKKLLESEKIQKKHISIELTITEFEKLNKHCKETNTSKNALIKKMLKKEDII